MNKGQSSPGFEHQSPSTDQTAAAQQPVAYDLQGRPLYAAPVRTTALETPPPQIVHMVRPLEPEQPIISPAVKAKHDDCVKQYPQLNLSAGEFIISAVRRHPIGLVLPVTATVILLAVVSALLILYPSIITAMAIIDPPAYSAIIVCALLIILLILIGGYIAIWVYLNNRFYLTNESVIQEIQTSLFARHEQTVSLANIEDASFEQRGLIQSILNYGSIRLSTEGDETTYRFHYVANPKAEIATLNNAVEAFKNGRPVEPNEQPE